MAKEVDKKKGAEVQGAETQTAGTEATNRKAWRDVLKERSAELDVDDELAVGDYLGEAFANFDRAEADRKQLNDLLAKDERAAGILAGLAGGVSENGEPFSLMAYLIENYGDDIREAATTEEAIQRAKEREAASIKEAAEAEARKKQAEENLQKADETLTEAVNRVNVDEKNVAAMLAWLYGSDDKEGFVHRIIRHELDAEDWAQLLHAFNMDAELAAARQEGAKQSKSVRAKTHRQMEDLPADLGGGGNGAGGEVDEDPTIAAMKKMKRRFG